MELIRFSENAIYRMGAGVVARICRPGQVRIAHREVLVARWLEKRDVPAVRLVTGLPQPTVVHDQAVTWWHELPPHRPGTTLEVAEALRRLHAAGPPDEGLDPLDPFARLAIRIDAAHTLTEDDRAWMRQHLADLQQGYATLPAGLPHGIVHGDAWGGNLAVTEDGRGVLLDLERCTLGPPEWDLISTAVKAFTVAQITADEYQESVRAYGHDVTRWGGFETLRDIREFRMTCMAAQVAAENPARQPEIEYRLACIRGERGQRPWTWVAVP
ncbi:phosphotransferase family protein [Nonomuraea typhae]|uniref:Phosphotransferase family protein n=1 Tax=Nonomuraea typhae TaxID=2603600 RepID=A0ABW7YMZ5_9ACTN